MKRTVFRKIIPDWYVLLKEYLTPLEAMAVLRPFKHPAPTCLCIRVAMSNAVHSKALDNKKVKVVSKELLDL